MTPYYNMYHKTIMNCIKNRHVEKNISIYDFLKSKNRYIEKCQGIIKEMMERDLINKLINVNHKNYKEIKKIYSQDFAHYDVNDAKYIRQFLVKLIENKQIDITDENTILHAYLMRKKYIIQPKSREIKVSCEVCVGKKRIKVCSYNRYKNGNIVYKNPKGSVEQNESYDDALLREMKEELGFTFPIDKYKHINTSKKLVTYCIKLSDDEYKDWYYSLDTMKLDPEITNIILES